MSRTRDRAGCVWDRSKWLSKADAAVYIHRSVQKLDEYIKRGEIFASSGDRRTGPTRSRIVYIHIDDLDAFMRSHPYVPEAEGPRAPVEAGEPRMMALTPCPPSDPETIRAAIQAADKAYERTRRREERKKKGEL